MGEFKRYGGKLPNGLLKTRAGDIQSNYGWDMIAVVKIGIKEYYEKV